jgi:hypothetical protein
MHHVGYFNRHFEDVIRRLCRDGHAIGLLFGPFPRKDLPEKYDPYSAAKACLAGAANCEIGEMASPRGWRSNLLGATRALLNYINYLRPEHPSPGRAQTWAKQLPSFFRAVVKHRWVRNLLTSKTWQHMLRAVERATPPDPAILSWLQTEQPDVVISSPFLMAHSSEVDYIKAAAALRIPTVVVVASWDNLTTKGVFHVLPDLLFVWNTALAEEATRLYNVPPDRIVFTGAQAFDYWFQMEALRDRRTFCDQAGIEAARPFVLYLCSSTSIASDETEFVKQLRQSLSENPDSRSAQIVVRPHPVNPSIWDNFTAKGVAVWPEGGTASHTLEDRQDFYDSLYHSSAVVGVNTSALIDAVILDKPCLTVITDHHRSGQAELGHFQHLINGRFLETAYSLSEAASVVADILSGIDRKAARRREFVQNFVRPHGLTRPASETVCLAIELAGLQKNAEQINSAIMAAEPENKQAV